MIVKLIEESGHKQAVLGLSLSYNSDPSPRVADNLAWKQGGHNKFLESMTLWIDIDAPRYWWQQFDTYRVGMTKQSESTMHTLMKGELTENNFQGGINGVILQELNGWLKDGQFDALKRHLPESFLQRRVVTTNYKVLQNMVVQRTTHKLWEWQYFIRQMKDQVGHPEYITLEI